MTAQRPKIRLSVVKSRAPDTTAKRPEAGGTFVWLTVAGSARMRTANDAQGGFAWGYQELTYRHFGPIIATDQGERWLARRPTNPYTPGIYVPRAF